jgi:phosphatidylserine/phosphatidylglycerophosphate/cardiolipin synthase-like enzyme
MMIIDSKVVYSGSANFTYAVLNNNNRDILYVFHTPYMVEQHQDEFNNAYKDKIPFVTNKINNVTEMAPIVYK